MNRQNSSPIKAFPVPGYVAADHPQNPLRAPLVSVNTNQQKKRQKTASTRPAIVAKYKKEVAKHWVDNNLLLRPWFNPDGLTLFCKRLDDSQLPPGFTKVSTNVDTPRYQYNFTDPETKGSRYRPVAYRMSFLENAEFYCKDYTVSHLCHNNWCYNYDHHVLEPLAVNKSRNGCPGDIHCHHSIKCLVPGEYSEV